MKDSLTLYEELISSGIPEAQAKIQAHQIGDVTTLVSDVQSSLYWMRIIGGAMAVAFFGNIITVFVTILCIK